jgi:hypothetical protein
MTVATALRQRVPGATIGRIEIVIGRGTTGFRAGYSVSGDQLVKTLEGRNDVVRILGNVGHVRIAN